MSSTKKLDLGLQTAYDELFMTEQGRAENRLAKIYDIPLSEIDDFPDHPYQVRMDEDMTQLVESVKERGIITPVTLRKKEDGRYEMVSGHRRKKACELAGLDTIKAEVKELTRDEASSCGRTLYNFGKENAKTMLTSCQQPDRIPMLTRCQ